MGKVFLALTGAAAPLDYVPVEVAWVDETGQSEMHLVRPTPHWFPKFAAQKWKDSEGYPNVSLERLQAEGETLEDVAARARAVLLAGREGVFVENERVQLRLTCLLAMAGYPMTIPVHGIEKAYGEACWPLMAKLPQRRSRNFTAAAQEHSDNCFAVVERCRRSEPPCPGGDRSALADALRLHRTWMAVGEEAKLMSRRRTA